VEWYQKQVEEFVPDQERRAEAARHPKLSATVHRTVELWERGEKVLIFCTYCRTATALRDHVRQAIDAAILRLVADKAGLERGRRSAAKQVLERVARRLSDEEGRLHKEVTTFVGGIVDRNEFEELAVFRDRLMKLLIAYIRSHSFIARYLPPHLLREDAAEHEGTFARVVEEAPDLSGTTLVDRIKEFLQFARELALRGQANSVADGTDEFDDPLGDYLEAVTASIRSRRVAQEEGIAGEKGMSFRALRTVRMVFGKTPQDIRERVMQAFNSPLFPEVLISSSVLGEGVDLHRFCRFVIHHDLSGLLPGETSSTGPGQAEAVVGVRV
jgi:hypothetical protein